MLYYFHNCGEEKDVDVYGSIS